MPPAAESASSAAAKDTPMLRITVGGLERTVPLDPLPFTFGRRPGHPLSIPLPQVSRDHAHIAAEGAGFALQDLGSTHGTLVNGARVHGKQPLHPGDVIEVPNCPGVRIVFEPKSEAASLFLTQMQKLGDSTHTNEFDRLQLLLDFSARLRTAGGLEEILSAMLDAALRLTGAERGFVFLREEAAAGQDRLLLRAGRAVGGKTLTDDSRISRSIVAKAAQSTEAFLMHDSHQNQGSDLAESVVAHDLRTVLAIPLKERTGVLYLDSHAASPVLGEVSREMLDLLANDAAQLVINAQLARRQEETKLAARVLEKELALAASIQQGLMGSKLPSVPFARLDGLSQACLQIGGDFFDAVALPDGIALVLADVSGKGAAAALLAASLQGLVHAQLQAGVPLARIAASANQFICERLAGEKYATLVLARLASDGELEYINCGHIPPLAVAAGRHRELSEGNMPVGLVPGAEYAAARDRLAPGERLVLVTDGVTEAAGPAGDAGPAMFGDSRLAECLRRGDSIQQVAAEVRSFCAGAPLADDLTLLEVHLHSA